MLEADLNYIRKDIVGRQKNGLYCKYSRIAKTVTVTNLTIEKHIAYWLSVYKAKYFQKECPNEIKTLLINTIKEKFENGLTDINKIIHLVQISNEDEKEKKRIIKALTTEKIPKMKKEKING